MTSDELINRLFGLAELAFRRSAGGKIASAGLGVLALTWGANFFISLTPALSARVGINASIQSAEMPGILKCGGTALGVTLVCLGCWMVYQTWQAEHRAQGRKRVIGIEVRGQADVVDTPLIRAIPEKIQGQRREILLDIRAQIAAGTPAQLQDALSHITDLSRDLRREKGGLAREDLSVFAGGIAPVPFLFLTGMLLDDDSQATLLDWARDAGHWKTLDEGSRSEQILPVTYPNQIGPEVVCVVSLSFKIQNEVIEKCWPNRPIVTLALESPLPDKLWSENQQKLIGKAFLEMVAQLQNLGVQRIHLALASSASLSIRLGRLYDRRNFPELLVYQYEKSNEVPYPWAIQMATHGINEARLVFVEAPT